MFNQQKGYVILQWSGDPCIPYPWNWIDCTSESDMRITNLNLSHNLLSGHLPKSLGQYLTRLQLLDLSFNQLSGSLPKSLDNAAQTLTYLNINGTSVLTALPSRLQRKQQDNSLTFSYGTTNPTPTHSHKKNAIIATAVVVPLLVIAVATATALWLKRKKSGGREGFPKFEKREFSYNDLKRITNQFETSIGTGGFGTVYLGFLEDGVQVAVKVHSDSSAQGVKELSAEMIKGLLLGDDDFKLHMNLH
ncbi:Leucine-rich repeat protein kinase family protein [Rhynchospora pubera]|uniref:Leucine-rich repeat protein kinase family protein n=1 Tax=Rhynchospora pubera TaxID=906938 RepID=A0AAV8BQT7_9POAL|nr:Leucine-rich repeat protein kinase family protein [Rhynchospora pubera]